VIVEDVRADPLFAADGLGAAAERAGFRAACAAPLVGRAGDVLGVLSAYFREPHRPAERELRLLDLFSRQAADVLDAAARRAERRRAEEALRQSETRLRSIIDNAGAAIYAKDLEGRYILSNRHHAALLGASPEAVIGKADADFNVSAGRSDEYRANDRRVAEAGRAMEFEETVAAPEGERAFLSVKFPLRDSGGAVAAVCGISTDITDRRRQELAARRALARVELLAQTAADLLASERPRTVVERLCTRVMDHLDCQCFFNFLLDEASGRLRLNACAGIPPEEARRIEWLERGTSVCGCVAQTGRRIVAERIATTADPRTDRVRGYGVRAYACHPLSAGGRTIGTLSFGARTRETFAEDELSLMKTVSDLVSVAMERERLLEQARRQAEDLNRAGAAKDRFLAALSHELRTPLTPVLAAVSAFQGDAALPADLREIFATIQRNIGLEVRLIDDLLDVTRIVTGKMRLVKRPADVSAALRDAARILSADLEAKGLVLTLDTPGEPYVISADPVRLQQVFWNLLRNAIKFTPAGGRVAIAARRKAGASGKERVVVDVTDTGAGIPPETLSRLFAPFEQGDAPAGRAAGGLGLGLTISRAVVEMHGGRIRASSAGPGRGATFTVELPLAAGPPPAAPAPREARDPGAPEGGARRLRILLVEDHADTAWLLARLLRTDGHAVSTAGSVAEGVAAATADGAAFDVLVSDLGLPDGSGYDLLRRIRASGSALKAICLSGYGSAGDVEQSRAAGFLDHVVKPVTLDALRAALRRATDGPA
jgi:PAS domain S-box-containing protein